MPDDDVMASKALLNSDEAEHESRLAMADRGEAVTVDGKTTLRMQGRELVVEGGYLVPRCRASGGVEATDGEGLTGCRSHQEESNVWWDWPTE
jgi:hypothetical protein